MALWNSAAPITEHDPVGQYLANRGLAVPNTGVLRFHAGLDYWHDGHCIGQFPAMLGVVTSPAGELVTIHRTYLTSDGHKAPVPTVKKLCRSEEHTSELQSLMRISYAVFCLNKTKNKNDQ